ncbi:hypothetical protein AB0C01_07460 [Micromonospora sp. NPDC048905]|uniref:hypothetical protein n=1 Tax=Micromonospora sp. NPDC048905 TaxID=3155494 RepID=UPI003403BE0E
MNDPHYRHDDWTWPRPDDWSERCTMDDSGLALKRDERVVVDVRSETDPWYRQPATVNQFVSGEEPLAAVTFDLLGTELVPRRALRRAY